MARTGTKYSDPLGIDRLTSVNLYVLKRETADGTKPIHKVEATSVPHLKRAIRAGALEQTGDGGWKLTAAGRKAIGLSGLGGKRMARKRRSLGAMVNLEDRGYKRGLWHGMLLVGLPLSFLWAYSEGKKKEREQESKGANGLGYAMSYLKNYGPPSMLGRF